MKAKEQKRINDEMWQEDIKHKLMIVEASSKGRAWQMKSRLMEDMKKITMDNAEIKALCEDLMLEFQDELRALVPNISAAK